jgi:hypothetical protein
MNKVQLVQLVMPTVRVGDRPPEGKQEEASLSEAKEKLDVSGVFAKLFVLIDSSASRSAAINILRQLIRPDPDWGKVFDELPAFVAPTPQLTQEELLLVNNERSSISPQILSKEFVGFLQGLPPEVLKELSADNFLILTSNGINYLERFRKSIAQLDFSMPIHLNNQYEERQLATEFAEFVSSGYAKRDSVAVKAEVKNWLNFIKLISWQDDEAKQALIHALNQLKQSLN